MTLNQLWRALLVGTGLCGLSSICAPAMAQSTNMLMPEGSKDVSFGAIIANMPRSEGGTRRETVLLPTVSGQWSNGIFAMPGAVAMHISDNPVLDYGPIITYDARQQRNDAVSKSNGLAVEAGAFLNYMFAYNVGLNSRAMYGGGDNRQGFKIDVSANLSMRIASHQSLSISTGAIWANSSYLQSTFGVDAQQAIVDGIPVYHASSGIKNVFVNGNWSWQISNKFSLSTGVLFTRLEGSAANSPLTENKNGYTYYSQLSYHF